MLLCAPEYLFTGNQSATRIQLLRDLAAEEKLALVAVDECHCALTWQHFRPEYSDLSGLKDDLQVPFLLLTAMYGLP